MAKETKKKRLTGRNAEDFAGRTDFLVDRFHDQTEDGRQSLCWIRIIGAVPVGCLLLFLRLDAHLQLRLRRNDRSDLIEELQMAALLVIVGGRA